MHSACYEYIFQSCRSLCIVLKIKEILTQKHFDVNNFAVIRIQKSPDFSELYLADYDIFLLFTWYFTDLTCRKYEYPNGNSVILPSLR